LPPLSDRPAAPRALPAFPTRRSSDLPRGLETELVPARGYQLELVPPVPLPRKLTLELLRMPAKVRDSVRRTREVLERVGADVVRSEEHTSELQSREKLVCRLLLEKKK